MLCFSFLSGFRLFGFLVTPENSSSDQRQACKKHELYVSFRDLGWQVRAGGSWGGFPGQRPHREGDLG